MREDARKGRGERRSRDGEEMTGESRDEGEGKKHTRARGGNTGARDQGRRAMSMQQVRGDRDRERGKEGRKDAEKT